MKAPFRRSALYASLFALATPVAMAQVVLEEMIVTAQKREEGLQDVPISVNSVSGVKMEQVGITNLEKLTAYVPNFSMNQTGISSTITIRGISSGINQSFEQSVGMYNDGIYFGKAQLARLPLFDMARIEVLRGPQPVLFGKNSIAGAVSLITQKPTRDFEGSLQALYEPDHDENDYRLVVNAPITDGLSMRASLLYREMDGWTENMNVNGRTEKNEEETVARISALWEASENLTFHVKYENAQFDTWGRNIETLNNLIREDCVDPKQPTCTSPAPISYLDAMQSRVALLNTLIGAGARSGPLIQGLVYDDGKLNDKRTAGPFDTSQNNVNNWMLNADYVLGDHTLTFVTGYVDYKSDESCDCDYSPAPIIDNSILTEEFSQFSQEIRLTSPGGETVDYIAGLFYQDSELDLADKINVPPNTLLRLLADALAGTSTNRQFEQDTEVWAAFAQATWNINEDWRLILGGRYTEEEKEGYRRQTIFNAAGTDVFNTSGLMNALYGALRVEAHQLDGSNSESAFTPVITGQWDVTDDTMVYLTYVEGFKSGGYDNRSNAHPDPAFITPGQNPATAATIVGAWEFDKEEATSIEFGAKNTLADGAAELNIAVFYTEYDDLQTSVFDGGIGFNVANAGKATTQGVEMDGRWALHEYFSLTGSLAYLDFEFDEFPVAQCYFGQIQLKPDTVTNAALSLCDAAGERKEYTPEWKGVISGDFMYPLMDGIELRATADLQFSDSYIWTPQLDPRTEQDAYYKVNARLALKSDIDTWEIALIGNNLTDERVVDYGGTSVLAGTLTSGTGMAYYAFTNRPRSYAIQGTWRF